MEEDAPVGVGCATFGLFPTTAAACAAALMRGYVVRQLRPDRPSDHHLALQAAGVPVPEQRDLRRARQHVGLRAARRRVEEQREALLVADVRVGQARHGRTRRRHPDAPVGLGRQRARRTLHRPAGRLHVLPPALPGRPARGRRLPRLRRYGHVHRRARLQPDVRDPRRPRPVGRQPGPPAARDGAGHLRQLRQHRHLHPPQGRPSASRR